MNIKFASTEIKIFFRSSSDAVRFGWGATSEWETYFTVTTGGYFCTLVRR